MKTLAFDIETNGLLDDVSELWCICIANVLCPTDVVTYTDAVPPCDEKMIAPLQEGLDRLASADRLVAHNGIGYDVPALGSEHLDRVELGHIDMWDTAVVASLLEPERRSVRLADFGEEMGYPKGDYDDWEGGYTEDMRVYCVRDVEICARMYHDQQKVLGAWAAKGFHMAEALEIEREVRKVLFKQERHGFRLDTKAAQMLDAELRGEMCGIEIELQEQFTPIIKPEKAVWDHNHRTWTKVQTFTPKRPNRTQGYEAGAPLTKITTQMFNPGSRKQIAERLSRELGWKPEKFTAGGTPIIDEGTLATLADKGLGPAVVMSRYLRVTKQLGQLSEGDNAWLRLVDVNGYVHGYVKSCGARTHRMSHYKPNMAQVDKRDKRMRAVWIPDRGDVLVGADAEGLELRMMAAYLYPADNGAYAAAVLHGNSADGTDVHTLNQKAVGLYSRDSAKTFFYAFLYGAGDGKLGQVIIDDAKAAGQPTPKGTAAQVGRIARDRISKGITGLDQLIQYAQAKAKADGYLRLP
jgi:DNA polymerase-1